MDKNFYKRNSIIKDMILIDNHVTELLNSMLDNLGDSEEIDTIVNRIESLQFKHHKLNALCDSLKP